MSQPGRIPTGSSSRGLAHSSPSPCSCCVHSGLALCRSSSLAFGSRVPAPTPVPPSWFLTTSTVSSATGLAGLLRPATGHEVRRVVTRDVVHTLRRVPLVSSRTASLQPLPPRRSYRPRGFAPLANPLSLPHRCRWGCARSSHGLVSPSRSFWLRCRLFACASRRRTALAPRGLGGASGQGVGGDPPRFLASRASLPRFPASSPKGAARAAGVCPEPKFASSRGAMPTFVGFFDVKERSESVSSAVRVSHLWLGSAVKQPH
jgi:hypothetical protein